MKVSEFGEVVFVFSFDSEYEFNLYAGNTGASGTQGGRGGSGRCGGGGGCNGGSGGSGGYGHNFVEDQLHAIEQV